MITIEARREGYTFKIGNELIGTLPATKLVQARPFDSLFTGTFLALYAHGDGQQSCRAPALFHHVSWKGTRE